jgi:hypothetical protein
MEREDSRRLAAAFLLFLAGAVTVRRARSEKENGRKKTPSRFLGKHHNRFHFFKVRMYFTTSRI